MPISDPSVFRPSGISPGEGLLNLAWTAAAPLLARHPRLADGIARRRVRLPLPRADLWIHAASVGEACLAVEVMESLAGENAWSILATAVTRQGYDILAGAARNPWPDPVKTDPDGRAAARVHPDFFPFDAPRLMDRAVEMIRPRAVVFLETEIWPGLLSVLRRRRIPSLMVNARMSAKSRRGYRLLGSFLRRRRPSVILPVSDEYAKNFAAIFGSGGIRTMPNIKFDRIRFSPPRPEASRALARIRGPAPFLVCGSVREEEEEAVFRMLDRVRRIICSPGCSSGASPDSSPDSSPGMAPVIGLFPRHLHRVKPWQERLESAGIPHRRRSLFSGFQAGTAAPGSVVIWDVFGELEAAYHAADAAFIGGSLAPVGGQNFMEALGAGISPVMGPSCYHFAWAGEEFFTSGLVRRVQNAEAAAALLAADLLSKDPPDRSVIRRQTKALIAPRRGGTRQAVEAIRAVLENPDRYFRTDTARRRRTGI